MVDPRQKHPLKSTNAPAEDSQNVDTSSHPASFGRRLLRSLFCDNGSDYPCLFRKACAVWIDSFLVNTFILVVSLAIGLPGILKIFLGIDPYSLGPKLELLSGLLCIVALLVITLGPVWCFLYQALYESSDLMATPGKLMMGLVVCTDSRIRLSFWRLSLGMLVQFAVVCIVTCLIGLFWRWISSCCGNSISLEHAFGDCYSFVVLTGISFVILGYRKGRKVMKRSVVDAGGSSLLAWTPRSTAERTVEIFVGCICLIWLLIDAQFVAPCAQAVCTAESGFSSNEKGDSRIATQLFDKAVSLVPNISYLYFAAAMCHENPQDFIRMASKAITLDSTNSFLYSQRARVYTKIGNFQSAEKDLGTAIALLGVSTTSSDEARLSECFFERARMYDVQRKHNQALQDLKSSLQVKPDSIDVYRLRATLYQRLNRPQLRAADERTIEELESGDLPEVSGSMTNAELDQLLKVYPGYARAYLHKGLLFQEHDQYKLALSQYLKGSRMAPNDPAFRERLGEAYEELNQLSSALAAYNKALTMSPNSSDILEKRGLLLLKLGRKRDGLKDIAQYFRHLRNRKSLLGNFSVQSVRSSALRYVTPAELDEASKTDRQ